MSEILTDHTSVDQREELLQLNNIRDRDPHHIATTDKIHYTLVQLIDEDEKRRHAKNRMKLEKKLIMSVGDQLHG